MTQPIEPVAPYNPWRVFIENVIAGDNYFRASEYRELLDYIDDLNAALEAAKQEGRRRGLEEAAQRIEPKNHPSDWTEFARINAESAAAIRALIEKGKP